MPESLWGLRAAELGGDLYTLGGKDRDHKEVASIHRLGGLDMVGTNHNEGICQWVNLAPIFFWCKLLPLTSGPHKFSKIRVLKVNYFHLPIHLANEL